MNDSNASPSETAYGVSVSKGVLQRVKREVERTDEITSGADLAVTLNDEEALEG